MPRVLPYGDHGLLLELGSLTEAQAAYRAVRALVAGGELPTPVDVVPGARTVLVAGLDRGAAPSWQAALGALRPDAAAPLPVESGVETVITVRYDGRDLAEVAAEWGCSTAAVVDRHLAAAFTVAFCGFAPGFAYCTADPPLPPVRRLAEPRRSVGAGSVALGGEFCGVYPRAMPGGWRLVGTTDAVLFDPDREPAALLRPGDHLRFTAGGRP
ncbi:MAG TPA: carboxyltransferase domain-containing protein [Nocardioidaceae bacterium]|nr:carboxyltransferase domain-containing protein [Nocardioidaceae bacterium]